MSDQIIIDGKQIPLDEASSSAKDLTLLNTEDDESTISYSINGKYGEKIDLPLSEIQSTMDNFFLKKDCKVGKLLKELELEFKKLKEEIPALRDAGMRVEFKIPRGYNTDLEKQVSEQISAE